MPIGSSSNLPPTSSGNFQTVPTFADLPDPVLSGVGAAYVTADTGTLYISSGAAWFATTGGGPVNGGTGVGGGSSVFKDLLAGVLRFKSLTSVDSSLTISSLANTLDLSVGVISIAHGGTGQSNQQAGLNALTNIAGGSDGDILTLLSGNAQWAAAPATGVTTFNTRTGAVTLIMDDITDTLGLPANTFLFSDGASQVTGYTDWQIDPNTHFSNVDSFLHPNNLPESPNTHGWNINVAPLQNSPNDSLTLHSFSINLDSAATGFDFGSNGQAACLLGGGYNYGGNGATIGYLRNINMFTGLGDGTNPGTFKGHCASAHSMNVSANITVDGQFQGYDFNLAFNAAAISTSNFNVLWLSDFSQIPIDLYGYQGLVCQPVISKIKSGHNFNAVSIQPNIGIMEGNAGFYSHQIGGTITTLGTSGYSAFGANTNITTVPATASILGFSNFIQIGTMAASSDFHGSNISPTITTFHGSYHGYETNPTISGGDGGVTFFAGNMNQVHTTGETTVLNLNGLTADGNMSSFNVDGVRTNIGGNLIPLSGQTTQGQHVIFTGYDQTGVGTITGTDILANILSPDVNYGTITDDMTLGPSGLGFNFVAFAGQMHGHGSMDLCSALIPTAIFSEDFTLGEWRNVNAYVINAGYSGACASATAFYHEVAGAGLFATTHWGLKVVTPGIENYVESMAFGTASKRVSNSSIAIELGGTTKAFVNLNVTTIERLALTATKGMQVYDTDLNQMAYYNGTVWVAF